MRALTLPVIAVSGILASHAQEPVWAPDVANILYTHCASCHHDGGIAPFALTSYADAEEHAWAIAEQVAQRHMPPWPADPNYRHFKDENVLTQGEIDAVVNWMLDGTPMGNPDLAPEPPTFPENGSLLETIDMVVAIDPYTLQDNTDEYRWFVVPTNFSDTVYVNAIEVFSGLSEIVHHADISFDMTGESATLDNTDPLPGFNSNTGSPVYSYYMNAWQPGGNIARYPPDWGIAVPPGADFVLEIHYGPGGIGLVDSTRMNLQFVTNTNDVRPVHVGWLLYDTSPCLIDGPLVIPANTVQTFHQERTMSQSSSFLSICPHMHLLGHSYKVWYEDDGETTGLIDIPHWDFHWQKYYTFQQVQVIPAGATIKSEGVYDNTIMNEHNPNDPPETVYRGSTTHDEMFLTYFIWTDYQAGDENIVLDSTIFLGTSDMQHAAMDWQLYPTPADEVVLIDLPVMPADRTTILVFDAQGRVVLEERMIGPARKAPLDIRALPPGLYSVQLTNANGSSAKRLVKR